MKCGEIDETKAGEMTIFTRSVAKESKRCKPETIYSACEKIKSRTHPNTTFLRTAENIAGFESNI